MPGIHHRSPGAIPAGVENENVQAEIICDGFHIHPASVRLAFTMFKNRMILVSDSGRCAGKDEGYRFDLGGQMAEIRGGVAMSWGMVFLTNVQNGISFISQRSWLFLILSGLATGASWLCYYRALQVGEASKVVPVDKLSVVITLVLAFVILKEPFTAKSAIGAALIAAGTLVMVL
jgi:transporter family protein